MFNRHCDGELIVLLVSGVLNVCKHLIVRFSTSNLRWSRETETTGKTVALKFAMRYFEGEFSQTFNHTYFSFPFDIFFAYIPDLSSAPLPFIVSFP